MTSPNFDDIRCYNEQELPDAIRRLTDDPLFWSIAKSVFPDDDSEAVRDRVRRCTTVYDFQRVLMSPAVQRVATDTISRFTYGGLQRINKTKSYLFIANHRDIVLDAALLQHVLFTNGYPTTQITFGANLMSSQFITDFGRINKMFRVERGGDRKRFYQSSAHLSDYIRHTICSGESVWIAQRNGRTKDGDDRTDQGIIKMFGMSDTGDDVASLAELRIAPIAISYEIEPCDMLKAVELYHSSAGKYVKKDGEDLHSILTGILQYKGRAHMEFCEPIGIDELEAERRASKNRSEFHIRVAALIDRRIYSAYRLWPTAFAAADALNGGRTYADYYDKETAEQLQERLKRMTFDNPTVTDTEHLRDIFLHIYANPVLLRHGIVK